MDWQKITTELQKKLDPKHIKPAPSGKYGDYIEGWHAIAEANRIFGFGGWSYTLDALQLTNATKDGDKHRVGYMAQVTVHVGDVRRGDVGHGQGFGKSEGDAHDSAVKEAVTDALKRALRTFGNPFGLALYDKTKANVGVPEASEDDKAEWLIQNIGKAKSIPQLEAWFSDPRRQKLYGDLGEENRARVDYAKEQHIAQLSEVSARGPQLDA